MLPKIFRRTRNFDEGKFMSILIEDDELPERYNKI